MTDPNACAQIMGTKEILEDALMSQKHITEGYNTFAGECVNEQLRHAFLNILDDEHTRPTCLAPCSPTAGTPWRAPSPRRSSRPGRSFPSSPDELCPLSFGRGAFCFLAISVGVSLRL